MHQPAGLQTVVPYLFVDGAAAFLQFLSEGLGAREMLRHAEGERSPKADAIAALRSVAFVDDYIAYMRGVPTEVHTALVLRAPNGSPNVGDELKLARSMHQDLADFTDHWLGR